MFESLFLPLVALASAQTSPPPPAATEPPGNQQAPRDTPTRLTSENRAALRCSAAFAIVSNREGEEQGASSTMSARGREFFVVTLAGIMDEHNLDRAAIEREVRREAESLAQTGEVDKIMPACLLMLQSAGL